MKALLVSLFIALILVPSAVPFCGFYVATGDAKIFNKASQVVLVRDGNRTVMTMSNDFKGDPKQFAVVIPVPTLLKKGQIHIADQRLIDHLDAYSAPRLVEYFDENPCQLAAKEEMAAQTSRDAGSMRANAPSIQKKLGVTIEARYTVGEYDILILSATESNGLAAWLEQNHYTIPRGAASVLDSYIRQNMKFFVAKVNVAEQSRLGFRTLRPIQVAYESPKFMLPIRLGTVNAQGTQDLMIYALTRNGRVETTNYRTVKLASDLEIPLYVRDRFKPFYRDLFAEQARKENMTAVFLEYAWNMNWCDPCASDPLTPAEQRQLGVFWIDPNGMRSGQGSEVFVTRMHVRYDRAHFPEDLVFQNTGDQSNFQARYIVRHPWTGSDSCQAADVYRESLIAREEKDALTLAELTGWNLSEIQRTANPTRATAPKKDDWWEKIWQ